MGLPGLNLDSERLRFENLIRDGIAPRLSDVAFWEIRRDPEPCSASHGAGLGFTW